MEHDNSYNKHIQVGLQNIDNNEFDDVLLKSKLLYPAIIIETEVVPGKYTGYSIYNSLNLKEGTHNLYIKLSDKRLNRLGKLELNIENIFRLENLLKRLKPVIRESMSEDEEFRAIEGKDLVYTIELDIWNIVN